MAQIILEEGAAPDTPSSGQIAVYAKTDGVLYFKDDTGAESSARGVESYGTFTGTLTGFSSNPTGDVGYFVNNGVVTLYLPDGIAALNSNATSMTLTGLPSALWPITVDARCTALVADTVLQLAYATVSNSTGVITFLKSDGSGFNTGVAKSLMKCVMQYPL